MPPDYEARAAEYDDDFYVGFTPFPDIAGYVIFTQSKSMPPSQATHHNNPINQKNTNCYFQRDLFRSPKY